MYLTSVSLDFENVIIIYEKGEGWLGIDRK